MFVIGPADASRVDGGATFLIRQRDTTIKAVVSVSGPLEVRQNQELPSISTLEITIRPKNGVPGTFEKELSGRMHRFLEQILFLSTIPRTLVQIVLHGQGNTDNQRHRLVASYLNATSAALLRTGSVPMRGVFFAVVISRKRGGDIIVNYERDDCEDLGTLGFLFERENVELVWVDWHGMLSQATLSDVIVAARVAARQMYDSFRNQMAS